MGNPKSGWLVQGVQCVIVAFVAAAIAVGCASPQAPNEGAAESMVQTVGEVSVVRDGDDSVIRLEGVVDPVYSVSTSDDGSTVVLDLVGVLGPVAGDLLSQVSDSSSQVAAYDGVVDLVTISTFDEDAGVPLTRVEVTLAQTGQPDVLSTGDGLEIRILPGGEETASFEELDASPMADEMAQDSELGFEEDWGSDGEMADAAPIAEVTPVEMPAPTPATVLNGISVDRTSAGVLLGLQADGEIGSIEAFTLENPARLVLDLAGLKSDGVPARTKVDAAQVKAVRTAAHDGKVRVVVDGGPEANGFEGRQMLPSATGVWLAIGSGEDLADALSAAKGEAEAAWMASLDAAGDVERVVETAALPIAEASPLDVVDEVEPNVPAAANDFESAALEPMQADTTEPMAEVAPANTTLSQVYGLHYERTNGMDRTAILTDEAVAYTTSAVDPTTLVVQIPGATISDEASDRIFPKAGGPVSLIHAFQQPEVSTPEVRVVFTRAPNQEPVITRRGSMLFVDFEDRGVAAAAPPAFPQAGGSDEAVAMTTTAPMTLDEMPQMAAPGSADMPAGPAALAAEMDGPGGLIVTDLPSFDADDPVAGVPAAMAAVDDDVWAAPAPAAVEVPAAIEVLEEGGLIDGKEYRGRRVSLDFKDVEIADVLRLIAEVSDLNIIAGDEVEGKVTIRLVETPWDQALDVVLMTKGLGFVRVGNVLRIAPSDVLKAEEEVRLQERRNKEKLEDLEVKLLPVNYAIGQETPRDSSSASCPPVARSTSTTRTNTLIIKDISSVIDEASALIAAIDTQTPQVMIEAKIVEANLDFSRELGSVWGVQTQQFVGSHFDPDTPRQDLGSARRT